MSALMHLKLSMLKVVNQAVLFMKQRTDQNTNNRLGWTSNLRFHVLLNSISVISERWIGDYESLCAVEPIADQKYK